MDDLKEKIDSLKSMLGQSGKSIAIVTHTNPDGDAIGASTTLATILGGMGHKCTCIIPNRYPDFLNWMPDIGKVLIFKEHHQQSIEVIEQAEFVFCVDFNQVDRLEALSDAILKHDRSHRILIDHHLSPPDEYGLQFSYPELCSSSFVVYKIVELLCGTDAIDRASAEKLYVGIMTDTGNFSFSFLTPDLFRAVATLVEKGVDVPKLNAAVYNAFSESRVRLLGYSLCNKMTLVHDNQVAYIGLKESELHRFDFQLGDSEGFVNFPLTIRGVKMSAMFLQTNKFIRVSLRSRGAIDVNLFAKRYFGGGGHMNAAGGKSFVSMEKTIAYFVQSVEEFFSTQQ